MGNLYIGGSGSGSATLSIQQLSADGSVTTWGTLVEVTCLTSDIVVTLPSALAGSKGMNVVIKKLDNTNYKVIIKGNNTDTIESISQNIYLYGQNDAVTFANTINNSRIISDNRNSTGSTASFTRLTRTISQTGVVASTDVIFTDADTNIGSGVTFNSTTGIITLKANSTFKLSGSTGSAKLTGQSAYVGFMWKKSVDGGTTWSNIGTLGCCISPSGTTWDVYGDEQATASITTTTQTLIKLSVTAISGTNTIGTMNDIPALSSLPYCEIEEMSRQVNTISTVDSLYAIPSSAITSVRQIPLNKINGNLNVNSYGGILLKSGKTYTLTASMAVRSNYCVYEWRDFTGVTSTDVTLTGTIISNATCGGSISANSGDSMSPTPSFLTITPSSDMEVRLVLTGISGGSVMNTNSSFVSVTQIGSTGVSKVPLSLVDNITEWTDASSLITIGVISGTAPTKATSATISARYKVIGKSLYFDYSYSTDNNTGASSGTGIYTINIASVLSAIGATVNTTLAPIDTNATGGTILYPKTAPVGNGTMVLNDGTNYNGGSVGIHIASATSLCMHGTAWNGSNNIASGWVSNVFYSMTLQKRYVGFKCIIPLV